GAERATLFLVDEARGELWSKVAAGAREIRLPKDSGIAGRVAATGAPMNVPDAYAEPMFNRSFDEASGFRTRSLLSMPMKAADGRVFAVMQLLNKEGGRPFDERDEEVFGELSEKMTVVLQAWTLMRDEERAVEEMTVVR